MKKLLISMTLLIGMVAGVMVLSSFTTPKQDTKAETMTTSTNLVYVKDIKCLEIDNVEGTYKMATRPLWKEENTCGVYYIGFNMDYKPVRANKNKTYKGVNVSSYKYYADCYWYTYFFNL